MFQLVKEHFPNSISTQMHVQSSVATIFMYKECTYVELKKNIYYDRYSQFDFI